MSSFQKRMPPLAGLLAYEATLRHGSMTLAADELGLTQSAVSHRIRALESFFGVALLERLNPGLRPTEAGTQLARELAPALATLADLQRRITPRTGLRRLRLGLSTSLLAWWLSPRLASLREAFPQMSIEILTWHTASEIDRSDVDLALLWLPSHYVPDSESQLPFPTEIVFPVAAPQMLEAHNPAIEWQALPLLSKGRRDEEMGQEWSWATWLRNRANDEAMRFRDIGTSLQAAVDGTGVALARSLLVADAVRLRRLIRLRGGCEPRACSKMQVASWRDPRDQAARQLAEWLVTSARETMAKSGEG